MKCKVCSREALPHPQSKYCELHQTAYESLRQKFEVWQTRVGLDWKSYLQGVARNPLTGAWAKEVAETLLSEGNLKSSAERNV